MKNLQIINYRIRGGDNYFKEINSSIKWLTIFIIGLISLKSVCCNSKLDNFKKSKEIELLKLNKSIINYDSINFNNKVNTSDTFNYDNFIEWIGFADSNINSQISEVKLNEVK